MTSELERSFIRFKELADKKAEITSDDLDALASEEVRTFEETYSLDFMKIESSTDSTPTAEIILSKEDEKMESKAEGDGPVDAICNAISDATGVKGKLLSYNVNSISDGLDAQGDVTINLLIGSKEYMGRGVSTDIIEASARAYLNAINKSLSR